jgi:hypothetical protein
MAASVPKPFSAYEGDEPFLFVSYSHADMADVYQDLEYLYKAKYRIWYDEGIQPSQDLYSKITQKIEACSYFLVFLSPTALESTFVPREILFGLEKKKPILPVYLSELRLIPQLELPLIATLKLKKYEQSRDEYLRQLMRPLREVQIPSIDEEFKLMIESRIDQAGGSWNEELNASLMFGAELLGIETERARKVLGEKLEELGLTGEYERLRKLVIFFLDSGEITTQVRGILKNRATEWKLNIRQCEKMIQQEAASRAKLVYEQGDTQAARRLLVSAVGESAPQSKEVRELLGQLDRKTPLDAKPQLQYEEDQRAGRDVPSVVTAERPQATEVTNQTAQGETKRESIPASVVASVQEMEVDVPAPQPPPSPRAAAVLDRAVVTIADTVSIAFRRIPAGEFVRGCPEEFIYHIQQKTSADVSVFRSFPLRTEPLEDFWMSLTSITNAQYHTFVKAQGHRYPSGWRGTTPPYPRAEADYPVTGVNWQDSVDFADWLGARLPTRAEYEKACRGEHGLLYPWGNNFDPVRCNTGESELDHVTGADAYPAGASVYGVLDLIGNVWEWTSDDRDQLRMTVGASYECSGEIYGVGFFDVSRPPDSSEKDLGFRIACSDVRKLLVKTVEFQDRPKADSQPV